MTTFVLISILAYAPLTWFAYEYQKLFDKLFTYMYFVNIFALILVQLTDRCYINYLFLGLNFFVVFALSLLEDKKY
mgnify:CR=1 FL=1